MLKRQLPRDTASVLGSLDFKKSVMARTGMSCTFVWVVQLCEADELADKHSASTASLMFQNIACLLVALDLVWM